MTPIEATAAGTKVGYMLIVSALPMLVALAVTWMKLPRNKALVATFVIVPLACILIALGVCMASGVIHFRVRPW